MEKLNIKIGKDGEIKGIPINMTIIGKGRFFPLENKAKDQKYWLIISPKELRAQNELLVFMGKSNGLEQITTKDSFFEEANLIIETTEQGRLFLPADKKKAASLDGKPIWRSQTADIFS